MKLITLIIAMLLPLPAFAQQATPDQIIGAEIVALMMQKGSLQKQVEQLQAALKAAQERVKALEDKYEPKKDSAPK